MTFDRAAPTIVPGRPGPPRPGRVVERGRLFALLDELSVAPGLWIDGPPGIGKTTLAASHLRARGVACLWLQLDDGDADPAGFVHALLDAAAAGMARDAPSAAMPSADDLRDVPACVRRALRRLAASFAPLASPWALVLDNAHALPPDSPVHVGLAAALDALPPGARLVVIGREPPPAAYTRALAGQRLASVGAAALRFDDDETRRLIALHRRDWPAPALQQLTDGWAAGMILLLAARAELAPDAALRSAPTRRRLFDFFAGEVLAGMPARDAVALMRIAFLPGATAAMADEIGGGAHAGALLAELAERGLFTDGREGALPVYAFHALFAEFLRARAAAELPADALRALRLDAARVLARHGRIDAAIDRLVAAQAWDDAAALIGAHAGAFVADGRTARLRDWIVALPPRLQASADVLYWLGCCDLTTDPARALHWLEAARRADPGHDLAFDIAAAAADAILSIGDDLHALDAWMPQLEAGAEAWLARPDDPGDLRVLPGLLGAFVHRTSAHPLAAALADRAERRIDRPDASGQRLLLGTLAYHLLWTGQTPRLERLIARVDRLGDETDDAAPATRLRWLGVSVLMRALLGHVDDARRHADRALALVVSIDGAAAEALRARAHLLVALAALAARDAEAARTHLAEAAARIERGQAIDATTHEFQLGLLRLLDGEWTGAERLMRAAVASGRASGWPLREHIALLGQTLAATQAGRLDDAQAALTAALSHPFHAGCRWHHWLAGLIEAHLHERRGRRPQALAALRSAFDVGRACGFDFGPMPYVCGDMMPRLAALALDHGVDPDFARHLIARHALPAPGDAGPAWPWPIRIRALGGFAIERDGRPVPAARKASRRPLELLKLLVAAGARPTAVDGLCAVLWPDADGDAARNSFDNTLHRLRRLLGGERHVRLHAGRVGLNPATCWHDAGALEAGVDALDALVGLVAPVAPAPPDPPSAPDGSADALLALAERVIALDGGALLAGDDDLPPVLAARARLAQRVARAIDAAARRLDAAGRVDDARRLRARPLPDL